MEEWGWFDSESSKGGAGEEVRNGNAENREERERAGSSGRGLAGSSGREEERNASKQC